MNLRGIVAVSGKPGLFKVIGQNKSGFVLESIDEQKVKLIVNLSTSKLASLEDITIFGEDDDLKLEDIFEKMKGASLPDLKKADGQALRVFFREVAPDHDEDKVYSSDIKKIINWFNILKDLPLFNEKALEEEAETEAIAEVETDSAEVAEPEKAAKQPKKKKASKASE